MQQVKVPTLREQIYAICTSTDSFQYGVTSGFDRLCTWNRSRWGLLLQFAHTVWEWSNALVWKSQYLTSVYRRVLTFACAHVYAHGRCGTLLELSRSIRIWMIRMLVMLSTADGRTLTHRASTDYHSDTEYCPLGLKE